MDDEAGRVRIAARIAGLARDQGDTVSAMQAVSEVIGAESESRPILAIARISESLNYWEEARRALESEEGSELEQARLLEVYGDSHSGSCHSCDFSYSIVVVKRWSSVL